jgi:hypothetical protein
MSTGPPLNFNNRWDIPVASRELTFQIGRTLRLLLELFAKTLVVFAQPFDLLRLAGTRVARWLVVHRVALASFALVPSPRAYEIATKCTTTKSCQVSEGLNCYQMSHGESYKDR